MARQTARPQQRVINVPVKANGEIDYARMPVPHIEALWMHCAIQFCQKHNGGRPVEVIRL